MEDDRQTVKVNFEIPFPNNRLAEITYHVIRVDKDLNTVYKELKVNDNVLSATLKACTVRNLRGAVNSFFKSVVLVSQTIDFLGETEAINYKGIHSQCDA